MKKGDSSSQVRLSICPPGGGRGLRWPGLFLGFKILIFNIFGGFQKIEYFWRYEDFVFLGINIKLEVISMNFRVFSEGQGTD